MIIYPAIDLLDGAVTRLVEGDFKQKTIYAQSPLELMRGFAREGALHIHLVDLSGAQNPNYRQSQMISMLIEMSALRMQVGGGIRQLEEIEELLAAGAERVVLGSLAVSNPELAQTALEKFTPERLTFALDVRLENGIPMVMTHGWQKAAGRSFQQVLEPFKNLQRVMCTDIATDGRAAGPNVELYAQLCRQYPQLEIQASGGVTKLDDLTALKRTGVHSVIVGSALMNGAFSLRDAIERAK